MARIRLKSPRPKQNGEKRTPLETMGILMLADADNESEELLALMFLIHALQNKRERLRRSGRYGRRGKYDRMKSKDFFDLLLNEYPERWFKWAYYCHKKYYAFAVQATVDHRAIFTSYDFGWPGSVQDSRVFRNSHLWRHRDRYFEKDEYILVDKGYPITPFAIRPFHLHDLTSNLDESRRRKKWNKQLSSVRISVEHAFGRLKGRFPMLRFMPGRIISSMQKQLEALMVLHNILEELGDDPTSIAGYNGREDEDVQQDRQAQQQDAFVPEDNGENNVLYQQGLHRRKLLVDYMEKHRLGD